MNFDQFTKSNYRFWNRHFTEAEKLHQQGNLMVTDEDSVVYPTTMNTIETPTHFILDLAGATQKFKPLNTRRAKYWSTDEYLGGAATGSPVMTLSTDNEFRNMSFGTVEAWRRFDNAHPFLESGRFMPGRLNASGSASRFFDFSKSNYVNLGNCYSLQELKPGFRLRFAIETYCILKSETVEAFESYLNEHVRSRSNVLGVLTTRRGQNEALSRGLAFVNAYMTPQREPSISQFLEQHSDVLAKALGARDIIAAPYLKWVDGHTGGDQAIIPDFMIQRLDGYWDICDLKLPLFTKNLTKSRRRRRTVTASVDDGLAQLAHYEEYFATPGNAQHALDKFNIQVSEPRKLLVIGNQFNYRRSDVSEAMRQRLSTFDIVNFDTLFHLYLASSGIVVPDKPSMLPPGWA